jgi:hypothetical protein
MGAYITKYMSTTSHQNTYDYIIIGAGSAGCRQTPPGLRSRVRRRSGSVKVVAGRYDLATGRVEILP